MVHVELFSSFYATNLTGCDSGHPWEHRFSGLLSALFVFEVSSAVTAIVVYSVVIAYIALVERLRSTLDVIQLHVCTTSRSFDDDKPK